MTTKNTTETTEMAEKLKAAGEKAEKAKAARRERTVKGSHLLEALQARATKAELKIEDKSGFLKITGSTKGRKVYVAKKGGRVDASGFTIENAAIKQISEQEAKDKHLGKVRGQIDFDQDDASVLAAYDALLAELNTPVAETKSETAAA